MGIYKSMRSPGSVRGSGVFLEPQSVLLRLSSASPSGTPVGGSQHSGHTEPLVGEVRPARPLCREVVAALAPVAR